MKIAIIVSEFNNEITSRMLSIARERAQSLDVIITATSHVPGTYDMPVVVDALLERNDVDAVITLGAIIHGKTKHDEVIANATAKTLMELSIKHHKPVTLGISGPGMQKRQAYARTRPVAERAVEAAIKIHSELVKVKT
ncbi:MAG: 6,7-dimethyl-8-ribityllumazine synthase [Cenarchaeum symbiont of Oopsacas minuta]|nr:6,7-dimethyl-8-ribityllumazine synthase [Cenarchaeum symbiont of Oopsacas minuta]